MPIYIESANSIQTQTPKNIEIITINDGSTDNTKKVIDRLKLSDPRLSLYSDNTSKLVLPEMLDAPGQKVNILPSRILTK